MTIPFLVKDLRPGSITSFPRHLTAVGDTLYFSAFDGSTGFELWKSNGSTAGTVLVKDINPGPYSSEPLNLTAVGDSLYFSARDSNGR